MTDPEMLENYREVVEDFNDGYAQMLQSKLQCSKVEAMQVWLLMRVAGAIETLVMRAIDDDNEEEWKQ